jgi:pilus assembly protein CpaF
VVEELGPTLYDRGMSDAELRLRVLEMLEWAVDQEQGLPLTSADRRALLNEIASDVLGYGPIDPLLNDPEVTEVMANGPYDIYYERSGRIHHSDVRFVDDVHLRRIIDKIVGQIGRRVDEATPMVDARLPDGSRVNAIIAPLAIGGPFLTIRKFAVDPFQEADLIAFGTLTQRVADFLRACVRGRLNVLISGGTGSGKTTTLNVVSAYIPGDERIITVEDAAELQLHQEHVLTLESRPANIEGKGEVTIRDLVKNTLRMRPDRIVVGEVRDAAALDMLQAMNTGHDGSLTTIHSNSPRDTLSRIETMVLMAGYDLPVRAIREQISSAVDLIVHVSRLKDGTRRITHVTEVEGMEGEIITLQDLFLFDYGMGVDDEGMYKGRLKATGIRPTFSEELENQGIRLPADLFDPEPFARR